MPGIGPGPDGSQISDIPTLGGHLPPATTLVHTMKIILIIILIINYNDDDNYYVYDD